MAPSQLFSPVSTAFASADAGSAAVATGKRVLAGAVVGYANSIRFPLAFSAPPGITAFAPTALRVEIKHNEKTIGSFWRDVWAPSVLIFLFIDPAHILETY